MRSIIIGIALTFATLSAWAQKDPRAGAVLDAMSKKYSALNSFTAQFAYTAEGAGGTTGDLSVKGKKFRLKTAGQEIFVDGKTTATFIKESNEVNIQDYDGSASGDFNPSKIYSMYKQGYNYRYVKEEKKGGRTLDVVELTPEKKGTQVTKVQMTVDRADRSVRSWQIFDKAGKRTTYSISRFVANPALPDSYFVFDKAKYPGVEVVDLR